MFHVTLSNEVQCIQRAVIIGLKLGMVLYWEQPLMIMLKIRRKMGRGTVGKKEKSMYESLRNKDQPRSFPEQTKPVQLLTQLNYQLNYPCTCYLLSYYISCFVWYIPKPHSMFGFEFSWFANHLFGVCTIHFYELLYL